MSDSNISIAMRYQIWGATTFEIPHPDYPLPVKHVSAHINQRCDKYGNYVNRCKFNRNVTHAGSWYINNDGEVESSNPNRMTSLEYKEGSDNIIIKFFLWNEMYTVPEKHRDHARFCAAGHEIHWEDYCKNNEFGWDIDHYIPQSDAKNTSHAYGNLQVMQTKINRITWQDDMIKTDDDGVIIAHKPHRTITKIFNIWIPGFQFGTEYDLQYKKALNTVVKYLNKFQPIQANYLIHDNFKYSTSF
jgi:hypothetical protein